MNVFLPPVEAKNTIPMYREFIRLGFEQLGCQVLSDLRQPAKSPLMAIDICDSERRRVWWDYSDFGIPTDGAGVPCLKIELRKADAGQPGLLPVGQVVPGVLTTHLPTILSVPRSNQTDVYCVMRVTNYDDRVRCIDAIRAGGWKSVTGLTGREGRPPVPGRIALPRKFPQLDNYHMQRAAKICVAAQGIGEKTWRHMETLAVGSCLVMPETDVIWPAPLDGCAVVCKRDWSDLGDIIDRLLAHDAEREEIARAGQEYWQRWCSPEATARIMMEAAKA